MASYLEINEKGEYVLDFSSLISGEKKSLPFDLEIDFPPFADDIASCKGKFKGCVEDKNEEYSLSFSMVAELKVLCSRCAEEMSFSVEQENFIPICGKKPERGTEEFDCFKRGKIDLSEILREFLILALPSQFLCKEDCAGLCQSCGKNLNSGACNCSNKEIDSRLQPLADLLKALNEDAGDDDYDDTETENNNLPGDDDYD
jgi:uncharacterized protein